MSDETRIFMLDIIASWAVGLLICWGLMELLIRVAAP